MSFNCRRQKIVYTVLDAIVKVFLDCCICHFNLTVLKWLSTIFLMLKGRLKMLFLGGLSSRVCLICFRCRRQKSVYTMFNVVVKSLFIMT